MNAKQQLRERFDATEQWHWNHRREYEWLDNGEAPGQIHWSNVHKGWRDRQWRTEGTIVRLFQVPYTAFGDYCGSHVESSNHATILGDFEGSKAVVECLGSMGSNCIMVAVDYLTNEEAQRMIETLDALADYPVLDESRWSNEEHEYACGDGWESFGRYDFRQALEAEVGEEAEDLPDSEIDALYWQAAEQEGYWPEFEAWQSPLYRVEDMAEAVARDWTPAPKTND